MATKSFAAIFTIETGVSAVPGIAFYRRRGVDGDAGQRAPDRFVRFCLAKAVAALETVQARRARRFHRA